MASTKESEKKYKGSDVVLKVKTNGVEVGVTADSFSSVDFSAVEILSGEDYYLAKAKSLVKK